jgi:succinate dehydrogenase flavin-adding protein (antitoxin of CptAB toxin-antitoxin module)
MRELDELLAHYVDASYGTASDAEKEAFRELLTLSDPELAGYLLAGQEIADGVSAGVIRQIRNRTRSDGAVT